MTFEEWCPVKITNEKKAPKAALIVRAYRVAWDAAIEEAAKAVCLACADGHDYRVCPAETIRALASPVPGKPAAETRGK